MNYSRRLSYFVLSYVANESAKGVWWVSYFVFYLENNKNLKTILTTIQPELLLPFLKWPKFFIFYLFNLPFSILPSTCDFPFTGPLLSYVPLSSLFLPPRFSNYYLEPVESHYDQRMRSTANKCHQGWRTERVTHSSPILTHNRYCPSPKALLPTKQAILWTASYNLLKVKPIYRQVLYVPICIL